MKMKHYSILAFVTFGLMFSNNCFSQNSKGSGKSGKNNQVVAVGTTNDEESESGTTSSPEDASGILKNHSKEIQFIIKNERGVIRGLDFGAPLSKIKATETAQYMSEGNDFILYKIQINEKESAEIIYYLDTNMKLKGFGIAFLVNAALVANDVEATLIDDFQNYFNERYGKFTTNEKNDDVWTAKDGSYTVEMGDSSEGLELTEIEIEIFKKK